ncbi:MAG: hypothetical protein AAB426_06135 [Myxococcota bacterium]
MSAILLSLVLASIQAEAPSGVPDAIVADRPQEEIAAPAPSAHDDGRVRVIHTATGVVVLDAPGNHEPTELALPPGAYRVEWQGPHGAGAQDLMVRDGGHEAIADANLLVRGATFALLPPPGELTSDQGEKNEPGARAELALYQTLHGIGVGIELCILAECDDPKAAIAVPTLAGGFALWISLLTTQGGITPGTAMAADTGTSWGLWHAIVTAAVVDEIDESKEIVSTLMAGQALGLGTGIAIARTLSPRAGQVALADTMGTWAGVLALLGHAANEFHGRSNTKWLTILAASDVGFAAGALLAPQFDMSRGRTLVIDAGGILGMLAGMGVAIIVDVGPDTTVPGFFGSAIAGTVLGLGLTTYLTQDWDVPELPAQVMVVPTDGGGMALVGARF